jgi:hypothetical protein
LKQENAKYEEDVNDENNNILLNEQTIEKLKSDIIKDIESKIGKTIQDKIQDKVDKELENIKTINNTSLLGNGNIEIQGGDSITIDQVYDPTSANAQSGVAIAGANFLTASSLDNYVTTNTDQNITGTKTFVGQKKIGFKQSASNNKLGFTLYDNNNVEKGYLEFNPTNTIDGAPLMTLGNYASSTSGITQVGFRRYSSVSGASGAYNLLTPLIADAKSPFSLTTTYTNFYLPLGFTDGTNTVLTSKSGLVDLSSILPSGVTVDQTYDATSANAQSGVAIARAGFLKNNADTSDSLAIGNDVSPHGGQDSVLLGHSTEGQSGTVALGYNASGGSNAVAIGYSSSASGDGSTSIGSASSATGNYAIQIGYGTNSVANSLSVGFYNSYTEHYNWQLLDGTTGLIPDARISSNIARTSQIPTPTYDSTNERITW